MEVIVNLDVVKATLTIILIIAIIALVIYLFYVLYNLVKTLKKTQTVLDDLEITAHIASTRAQQLDKLIEQMAQKLKSGQNIFSAIPIIFTAVQKMAKVVGRKKPNPDNTQENK